MATISIADLDKAQLLAELVNNTKPLGMGIYEAYTKPPIMLREHAEEILKGRDHSILPPDIRYYFDYLWGRPIKMNLSGDDVCTEMYDYHAKHGDGTAARIITALRG